MKVHIQTETGGSFYVKSLTAIPYDEWSLELVEPKPLCITTEGPEFDRWVMFWLWQLFEQFSAH